MIFLILLLFASFTGSLAENGQKRLRISIKDANDTRIVKKIETDPNLHVSIFHIGNEAITMIFSDLDELKLVEKRLAKEQIEYTITDYAPKLVPVADRSAIFKPIKKPDFDHGPSFFGRSHPSAFGGHHPHFPRKHQKPELDLGSYHPFDNQVEIMDKIVAAGKGVRKYSLGKTEEGRDIWALAFDCLDPKPETPLVFIDAGHHAREWIAPASALWIAQQLSSSSSPIRSQVDIILVPNVNPDGYTYSMRIDRDWRKNRAKLGNSSCVGVDLNRNYPFHWGEAELGENSDACREIFKGWAPGSEPEVQAIMRVHEENKGKIKAYVSLHSYGQMMLFPFGYKKGLNPENADELRSIGEAMRAAVEKNTGEEYVVQPAADLYEAAGASDDYAASLGIPYVFTLELSPDDHDGAEFNLPVDRIETTAKDAFDAITVLIQRVFEKFSAQ